MQRTKQPTEEKDYQTSTILSASLVTLSQTLKQLSSVNQLQAHQIVAAILLKEWPQLDQLSLL